MAKAKDIVAARYDAVRDRVVGGGKIDDAIRAEFPNTDIAPATLRAAYLGLAREKGHTKARAAKPALDIEAFRARFDAAVAEREAGQRSNFAALVEQLGDHLRAVAGRHPPAWVRKTIAAAGVPVTKEEFAEWLGGVVESASRKQKSSKPLQVAKDDPALTKGTERDAHPIVEPEPEKGRPDDNVSEPPRAVSSTKPPRPKVHGVQAR